MDRAHNIDVTENPQVGSSGSFLCQNQLCPIEPNVVTRRVNRK